MAEQKEEKTFDITESIGKTERYIEENKKSLSIIGGAVLVVVAGYFGYMNFIVKPQQESAVKEMFMAEKYFAKDSIDKALLGDGNFPGFLQIIDDYGSSQAANLSHYYAGMCYIKKKQWDEAIDYLKSYDAEDDITGALALGSIGDAYLEKGDKDEALNYYEKAAGWDDNDFSAPVFMKKAAMVHELNNDYKAALKVYREIKENYPASTEGREIDKFIARSEAMAE